MKTAIWGKGLKASLLAATCLAASPAAAQTGAPSIEDRLDRLESLVETLIERLDANEDASAAEQQAMREQGEVLLAATQDLQVRQAELANQIETTPPPTAVPGRTTFAYSGYVKLDAISQRTSGGQLPGNSILRDFLFPGAIPVGGEASGFDTDFSARQTRFIFQTATDVGSDHTLRGLIELDFNVTEGGNERVSNSFVPRIRQAFLVYDNWMFGQAWSTFQDVGALPDSLDFIGVTPGTVFDRQPMIRYTSGGLQLAVEQPETVVTTAGGGRMEAGDDTLPDFVARYNYTGDFGRITVAGILRNLRIQDDDFASGNDSAIGYGVSLSGRINVGERDDVRFMVTAGDGIGRYIGLNLVNDAAIDADGNLDPIATYSGFLAYRHVWADNLRSTVAGSYFRADNPVLLTTDQVTDESWNALANLVWSPVDPIDIGIELMYAERTLEDGRTGDLQRIQFSTRYNF